MKSVKVNDVVSMVEYLQGYELSDQSMKVVVLEKSAGFVAALGIEREQIGVPFNREVMEECLDNIEPMFPHDSHRLLLIDRNADIAEGRVELADALSVAQMRGWTDTVALHMDDERHLWLQNDGGPWMDIGVAPRENPQMVVDGFNAPARSQEEYLARFRPHEKAGFDLNDDDEWAVSLKYVASPEEQSEFARQCVKKLSELEEHEPVPTSQKKVLVSLMQSADARFAAIEEGAKRSVTRRLTEIARETPKEHRGNMYEVAGSVQFLAGSSTAARVLLKEARDRKSELAETLLKVADAGASPLDVSKGLSEMTRDHLRENQARWERVYNSPRMPLGESRNRADTIKVLTALHKFKSVPLTVENPEELAKDVTTRLRSNPTLPYLVSKMTINDQELADTFDQVLGYSPDEDSAKVAVGMLGATGRLWGEITEETPEAAWIYLNEAIEYETKNYPQGSHLQTFYTSMSEHPFGALEAFDARKVENAESNRDESLARDAAAETAMKHTEIDGVEW